MRQKALTDWETEALMGNGLPQGLTVTHWWIYTFSPITFPLLLLPVRTWMGVRAVARANGKCRLGTFRKGLAGRMQYRSCL